jgi:hypothetical protein
MGFTSIHDPGKGVYNTGDVFQLQLDIAKGDPAPTMVLWFVDEKAVSDAVTLTQGKHTVRAVLRYSGNDMENLDLTIEAK